LRRLLPPLHHLLPKHQSSLQLRHLSPSLPSSSLLPHQSRPSSLRSSQARHPSSSRPSSLR
jgi:hypothetical protein